MEENKYHFAREVIFNLRSCHAVSNEVYLHWIDKLNNDEQEALRQPPVIGSVCTCLNAQTEKYSQVPVYCHNCKAYVQTDR